MSDIYLLCGHRPDGDVHCRKCCENESTHQYETGYDQAVKDLKAKFEALEERNRGLVSALEKIMDKENWGYIDESGCPKGYGMYTEAWVKESHPIDIAKEALAQSTDGGKV